MTTQGSVGQTGGIDFAALTEPFGPDAVKWRLQSCGYDAGKGTFYGRCVAYVDARSIMERLDEVVGPGNWQNDYRNGPSGGVLGGLGIRVNGEWVWKWDGAENTKVEAVKGGLSGAFRRAAVQWRIGRYLYELPAMKVIVADRGRFAGKTKDERTFRWDPPELPEWALPGGSGKPPARTVARTTDRPARPAGPQNRPIREGQQPTAATKPTASGTGTRSRDVASPETVGALIETMKPAEWTDEERDAVDAWLQERTRTEEEVGLRLARARHELDKRRGKQRLAVA